MKNIQVIDGVENCVSDIFTATDEEFTLVFPEGQDIAFISRFYSRENSINWDHAFAIIWTRRLSKPEVRGIHGTIFYELDHKLDYYPTRCDEDALNPDGTSLRKMPTTGQERSRYSDDGVAKARSLHAQSAWMAMMSYSAVAQVESDYFSRRFKNFSPMVER